MTRDMQDDSVAVCVVDYKNILGEVPDSDVTEQALYWVDIEGCLLQRLIPAIGATRSWRLRERICALALRASGGMLLALASGCAFFDAGTMGLRRLAATRAAGSGPVRWMTGSQRRQGRSIASMPISAAIAWKPASAFRAVLPGARTQASSTSPTLRRMIFAYDFDIDPGSIGNRRVLTDCAGQPGAPDGSAVDVEGFLWNAQWDGWRLVRYAQDGRVDRILLLPVQKLTSCVFGGRI